MSLTILLKKKKKKKKFKKRAWSPKATKIPS